MPADCPGVRGISNVQRKFCLMKLSNAEGWRLPVFYCR